MTQLRVFTYAAITAATSVFSTPSYAINAETLIRPGVARAYVGRVFGPGDRLFSENQEFRFERQVDGNLVVRRNSDDKVYWASDTDNKGVQTVRLDEGPLLRAYTSTSRTVWRAGYLDSYYGYGKPTEPKFGPTWITGFLDMQDDGNLVIKGLKTSWSSRKSSTDYGGSNVFFSTNSYIYRGSSYSSGNGHYKLIFQNDGNLVITHDNAPIWSTKTSGKGGTYAVVQDDGNFVMYNNAKKAVWSAKNLYNSPTYLTLRTDGRLDLITEQPVWDSASDKGKKP